MIIFPLTKIKTTHNIEIYPEGSILYDRISAQRGKLEPIVIRKINIIKKSKTVWLVYYTDSLNYNYLERDLLIFSDAKQLVLNRLLDQLQKLENELLR